MKIETNENAFPITKSRERKIRDAKLEEKIGPFEVFIDRSIRPTDSKYGKDPVLKDFPLDDEIVDIYRTDDKNSWHNIYIHVKGKVKKNE